MTTLLFILFIFPSTLLAQQISPNQSSPITHETMQDLRLMAYYDLPDAREVLWSPGNLRLAVSANEQVYIFSTLDLNAAPIIINHNSLILDMAFNPDGSLLAVASEDELKIWRVQDGNLYDEPSTLINANDIDYSTDGSLIAFTDIDDNSLKWWNTLTDEIRILSQTENEDQFYINVDFVDDGTAVGALLNTGHIHTFNVATGRRQYTRSSENTPSTESYEVWHDLFALRGNGRSALRVDNVDGDGILAVPTLPTDDTSVYIHAVSDTITDFAMYETVVMAAAGDYILFHSTVLGSENSMSLPHPDVTSVDIANDGTQIASVGGGQVRLWRTEADMFTRSQLGSFSQQVVDINCTSENEPAIRSSRTTSASWSWFANTREQLDDHIYNAQYDIQYDGNAVNRWVFLSAPEQQGDDFVVYYYLPVGQLQWGRHGFLYELSWREAISDGYADFGPDTDYESEAGRCVFTISQD